MSDLLPLYTVARRRHRERSQEDNPTETQQRQHFSTAEASALINGGFSSLKSFVSSPTLSIWKSTQITSTNSQPVDTVLSHSASSSNLPLLPTIADEMPSRDRTAEFRTTAKSYQMKVQASNGHAGPKTTNKIVQESVQFNQLAKRIGRDLGQTCAKMEKLAELAKRRSLFDDRVKEVEELTHEIKQDITGLNKQIAALQEIGKSHQQNGQTRLQGQSHSKFVVVGLQSKLASVSSDFKQVLEIRTENLKQQKNRREMFSQSKPIPTGLPPSASSGRMGSVLLHDDAVASGSSVAVDMDHIERNRVQQQISLIDEQDTYLQARNSTMESIESSISELGSIFRQLANLVAEQGETITRIDSNVEETALHVEAAHMELLKYFRNISRNRWLMIKVFGVLIVFFIVFIIFMT